MDIDCQRELADDKHINRTGPESDSEEQCAVCGRKCSLVNERWLKAETVFIENDGEGDYLDGEDLPEADDSKLGFYCSERCASDLMYRKADPLDRKALDAVLDACRVLVEHGDKVSDIVLRSPLSGALSGEELVSNANDFLDAVRTAQQPRWTDRDSREDRLWGVMYKAQISLKVFAQYELGWDAARIAEQPAPISALDELRCNRLAKKAATIAHIAIDLRDALKEGGE